MRVSSRAMRKDEAVVVGCFRDVQESADRRIDRFIQQLANGTRVQDFILNRSRHGTGDNTHRINAHICITHVFTRQKNFLLPMNQIAGFFAPLLSRGACAVGLDC